MNLKMLRSVLERQRAAAEAESLLLVTPVRVNRNSEFPTTKLLDKHTKLVSQ